MNMHTHDYRRVGEDALGKAIAARLSEGSENLPHDISERLKAARAQAVSRRKVEASPVPTLVMLSNTEAALHFQLGESSWLSRIASVLPLLALVAGLVSIAALQDDQRATELAEVDAELLTDELPPSAFIDPGFAQFLRAKHAN